jgi:hypothetical protein
MTYNQFLKLHNNLQKLLICLGVLTTKRFIIKINNSPDYDISKYEREADADYFFNNSWDFSNKLQSVVDINFIDNKLYHFDDLERASEELALQFDESDHTQFINDLYTNNNNWFSQNGMNPDIDQFKLYSLRIASIDNISKKLNYQGSFYGNHETFDPMDWGLYSLIELTGVPQETENFFKELIGESYTLLNEGKNKLAYFLAYSAFDSFVNSELPSINDDKRRLNEKVTELYRKKFPQLDRHQIYTSIIKEFDTFTENRNNIAHGTNNITITKEDVLSALLFISIMIRSFEISCSTFDDLAEQL